MAGGSLLSLLLGLLLACWQHTPARAQQAGEIHSSQRSLQHGDKLAEALSDADGEDALTTGRRAPIAIGRLINSLTSVQTALAGTQGKTCGVASVKKDRWEVPSSLKPQCGVLMAMNCSISYMQMRCPDSCPFLAPHAYYPCRFRCVKEPDCSDTNRNLAYANQTINACMKCPLDGCAWCESKTICKECFRGFFMQDGKCEFSLLAGNWPTITMVVLVVLIVILIVTGLCYYYSQPWSEHMEHNSHAIMAGRRHRRLSKVMRWDFKSALHPRTWYTLGIDVNTENILGAGLALFYSSVCFVFVASVLVFGCAFYLLSSSTVATAILPSGMSSVSFETSFEEALLHQTEVHALAPPSFMVSPLDQCSWRTPHNFAHSLLEYALKSAICYGCLYGVLFIMSIIFARSQYHRAQDFDAMHKSMKDFCVLLTGLPTSQTNEHALANWLRQQLDMDIEGVSIQYDYHEKEREVNDMLTRHHVFLQQELQALSDDDELFGKAEMDKLKEEIREDRKTVKELFEGESALKGSGQAFVVFKRSSDCDKVKDAFAKNPNLLVHPDAPRPLTVELVQSEPADVLWQNAHLTQEQISQNEKKSMLWVSFMFVLLNGIITWPWYIFAVIPYSRSGSNISGPVTLLSGILMGAVNGILGGQVNGAAFGVGYGRKDRADIFKFVMNTAFNLINTMLNVYLFAFAALEKTSSQTKGNILTTIDRSEWLGEEADVVGNVLSMMVGGNLFLNTLMGMVNNSLIQPLLWTLMQKVIYVWRCWPWFLLKILHVILPFSPPSMERYEVYSAEKALEAPQVDLPVDYGALISNSVVVFWCLSLVSPRLWELCAALVAFGAFFWVFSRQMHLRVYSVGFISTHRLDHVMMLFWGLPLSLVGTAAVVWCIRAGLILVDAESFIKIPVLVATTCTGWLVWAALVACVYPYSLMSVPDLEPGTLADCKVRWCFTWFNCNPIFALKCLYYLQDEDGKTREDWKHPLACGEDENNVRFYRFGKEYLFMSKEKQKYVTANITNYTEPEALLWAICGCLDRLFTPRSMRKVEAKQSEGAENSRAVESEASRLLLSS